MSKVLFDELSERCSRATTRTYSTSFSLGIRCLQKELRQPMYAIYGFVRFADEIVDTFHGYDKKGLLNLFREETHRAVENKISLNPILNSFQHTVHACGIESDLYDQFLTSMEMDLTEKSYDDAGIQKYILGSAQVVGLMSLRVFCKGDAAAYEKLKPAAMSLGAAFQKVNFMRDMNLDYHGMGRSYFPGVDLSRLDEAVKKKIEHEIAMDFEAGYKGVIQLPKNARLGVYVAYLYYVALFKKIKNTPSEHILKNRVRIDNSRKLTILAYSYVKYQLNMI